MMARTVDVDLVVDVDEHGQGEAIAWVVLAGVWVGLCLTAGRTLVGLGRTVLFGSPYQDRWPGLRRRP